MTWACWDVGGQKGPQPKWVPSYTPGRFIT